jgi:hypothetical protein
MAEVFPILKRQLKDLHQLFGRYSWMLMYMNLVGPPTKPRNKSDAERLLLLAINEHLQGKFGFGLTVNDSADAGPGSAPPAEADAVA